MNTFLLKNAKILRKKIQREDINAKDNDLSKKKTKAN